MLNNGIGVIRENNDLMEINWKGRNHGDPKESIPKLATDASMSNGVRFMPTQENTTLIFGTKTRLSAPVVAESAEVGKSQGIGFAGSVKVPLNYLIDHIVTGGLTEKFPGFDRDKPFEAKR